MFTNFGWNQFGFHHHEFQNIKKKIENWKNKHPNWDSKGLTPPAPPTSPDIPKNYEFLTKHLQNSQWENIRTYRLNNLQHIKHFAKNLMQAKWDEIIPQKINKDVAYLNSERVKALQAYEMKFISEEQFVTYSLIQDLIRQCIISPIFFASIKLNDVYITHTNKLKNISPKIYKNLNKITHYKLFNYYGELTSCSKEKLIPFLGLSQTHLPLFIKRMKEKHVETSEKYFFSCPIINIKTENYSPLLSKVTKVINALLPTEIIHNFLKPITLKYKYSIDRKYQILPSFTMLNVVLDIILGPDRVKLKPAYGTLSERDIEYCHKLDCHPINLKTPDSQYPEKADGIPSYGNLNFVCHDIYHSIRLSLISPKNRAAILHFVDLLRKHKTSNADSLATLLVDGELHNSHFMDHKFGDIFNFHKKYWAKELKNLLLEDLVNNPLLWVKSFDIYYHDFNVNEFNFIIKIINKPHHCTLKIWKKISLHYKKAILRFIKIFTIYINSLNNNEEYEKKTSDIFLVINSLLKFDFLKKCLKTKNFISLIFDLINDRNKDLTHCIIWEMALNKTYWKSIKFDESCLPNKFLNTYFEFSKIQKSNSLTTNKLNFNTL